MVLVEVHQLRFDDRPILHRLSDSVGKLTFVHLPALRTALDLDLMFGDFEAHARQVKHLAPFILADRDFRQRSLAPLTVRHWMDTDRIRLFHCFQ